MERGEFTDKVELYVLYDVSLKQRNRTAVNSGGHVSPIVNDVCWTKLLRKNLRYLHRRKSYRLDRCVFGHISLTPRDIFLRASLSMVSDHSKVRLPREIDGGIKTQ